ncbi:cupin domain-containing protein [Streptomyces sp. NPDC006261]|uniref:cupin domain-containing protein n=1 Tax=Streptomyces sp. NPDC006261 TaxID=3156739 RepID=UPI0033B37545
MSAKVGETPLRSRWPTASYAELATRHGRHPELRAAVQLLGAELENPRIGPAGIVPALIDSLLLHILRA